MVQDFLGTQGEGKGIAVFPRYFAIRNNLASPGTIFEHAVPKMHKFKFLYINNQINTGGVFLIHITDLEISINTYKY